MRQFNAMWLRRVLGCAIISLSLTCVFSAESAAKLISSSAPVSGVQWRPATKQLSYIRGVGIGGTGRTALFAYDLDTAKETLLYDPAVNTAPVDEVSLPHDYAWSPNGDAILFSRQKQLWLLPGPNKLPKMLVKDNAEIESISFSPDGKSAAFIQKNNIYSVDIASQLIQQLTKDGSEAILNGKADWVYGEEFEEANPSGRAYAWSPDSKRIAFLRWDQSKVSEHPIVNFLQTHATITQQRYPKAGDANSKMSVRVVTVADGAMQTMPEIEGAEYVLPELTWTPGGSAIAVMSLNRAQNDLSLFEWPAAALEAPRLILHEKDKAWVNVYGGPLYLPANEQKDGAKSHAPRFVWLSERDGWLHAYGYSHDGAVQQITHGNWMIVPKAMHHMTGQAVEVDPSGEWLYFSATEKDVRERHIYRARIDAKNAVPERLTKEAGTHFGKLSPDGRFLIETFSSIENPPVTRVLKADGEILAVLYQSGGRVKNASAEFHEVSAPDGAMLHARMIKPPDFNPEKKYPVVVSVYGGPSIQTVVNAWGADNWLNLRLAQEGCIVWALDNRGSFARGHDWETAIFKNMGAREMADQLVGLEYLKKLQFVDTRRVGVWGWSYGGYMTLYMLTHAPDVFKCGMAGAPVTDWKFYDTIYTERYMRTPAENPAGYAASSPLMAAGRLKAKVLIVHGTSDDNVHIQNTMNFLDALTKNGKPYELQIQPGQKHGFNGNHAWIFLTDQALDFFKRNLQPHP